MAFEHLDDAALRREIDKAARSALKGYDGAADRYDWLLSELAARGGGSPRAGEAAAVDTGAVPPQPPDVPPPLTGPKPPPPGYSVFRGPATIEEAVRGAAQPPNEYDPYIVPHDGGPWMPSYSPAIVAVWAVAAVLIAAGAVSMWLTGWFQ